MIFLPRQLLLHIHGEFDVLRTLTLVFLALATAPSFGQSGTPSPDGFVPLFDGKTLGGWTAAKENPESWTVREGSLVCAGERCHLFYTGPLAPLKNFHFRCEVKTTPGSNAGIYFHTRYQDEGWPRQGFECQVNVSHKDPKKSGSLYAVRDVADPGVRDNEWYVQEIVVQGDRVVLKINGKVTVDYTQPADAKPADARFERLLGEGTFALQAHDPQSVVFFRNVSVKPLP